MATIMLATKVLISSFVFSSIAITCFLAGITGNVWWIIETNVETQTQGLWRNCTTTQNSTDCVTRDDILTFRNKKGMDPIILCIIMSSFFILLTIFLSLGMLFCCRRQPNAWLKTVKWNVVFGIVSVVSIVDAMLYTEIEFYKLFQKSQRGWSYYITWVGCGLQIISFILLLCQLSLKPRIPINVMTQAW